MQLFKKFFKNEDGGEMPPNKLGKPLGQDFKKNFDDKGENVNKHRSIRTGTAFDVVVVESEDGTLYQNSDFFANFKGKDPSKNTIVLEVGQTWFHISVGTVGDNDEQTGGEHHDASEDGPMIALKSLLKPGRNSIRYLMLDERMQVVDAAAPANIFLWKHTDRLVVSDIDGTITTSNARGALGTIATKRYEDVSHDGICHLLTAFTEESSPDTAAAATTRVVYVTSRPITLANETREFLANLSQPSAAATTEAGDRDSSSQRDTLPEGPLLGFGGNMPKVLAMELVSKTTQQFKSGTLWQQVVMPFRHANGIGSSNGDDENEIDRRNTPFFVAGFGNNIMDMQAYHAIGIGLDRCFKIDKKSKIVAFDKKKKQEGSEEGEYSELRFPPQKWYEDRIGSEYDGYGDKKFLSRFDFSNQNDA